MEKPEAKKQIVPEKEVVKLFWQGMTIKMLADRVSTRECCSKGKAREKVEKALYEYEMAQSRKARMRKEKAEL